MIVKTEAVVLKSMRFRETSKIVTFYTRRYGKLAAVAKGARDTKSKFGASLEPMTGVALVVYKKEHRDLQLVSQCDIIRPYKKIHAEMDRMSVALSILELLHQLTHEEEENPVLFTLVVDALDALEGSSGVLMNFFYAFELRFARVFGFAPEMDRCVRCGRSLPAERTTETIVFQLDKGGILCDACAETERSRAPSIERIAMSFDRGRPPAAVSIRIPTARVMQRLYQADLPSLGTLEYTPAVGNELDATLRSYLRYHFEDLKPLKTTEVFGKIAP